MTSKPLRSRPLDLLYFAFFAIHIPNTLLVDLQALYPSHLLPGSIANLPKLYVNLSSDPLIGGAMGYFGLPDDYVWFKSFLLLEAFFQLPVFVLGLRGLWKGSRSIYLLLLIYGASTTTTLLPCLAVLFSTPITSADTIAAKAVSVTSEQRLLLLSSYIPFLIIPLVMTVDMAFRLHHLAQAAAATEKQIKSR
ncbi:unnamed protein product [Somion occarium]|uniref:Efficient mitochondria targeting-associated protein 19 n=1 Tax=Somion occarium TaxID=3059160 RepID=A0ABP1E6A9_9APHY